ncbi:50S ribosomal protein L18 [uncultured archaeon]|nr:50S ribosomal protein L18 [uncultured archaeon]
MKIDKRRRRESKTDYARRFKLLKGESPRIVFRKTNKYIIAQYVSSREAQDKIEIGITSKNLKKYGWPDEFSGSLKSVPASYLTGFLLGKEIIGKKLKAPIADIGMIRAISKNKAFAFLKGINDAGVKIKCPEENFPDEDRISGKNMKKDFSKTFKEIKSSIEKK